MWKIADLVKWGKEVFGIAAGYNIRILRNTVFAVKLSQLFNRLPGSHYDLVIFEVVDAFAHIFKLVNAVVATRAEKHDYQRYVLLQLAAMKNTLVNRFYFESGHVPVLFVGWVFGLCNAGIQCKERNQREYPMFHSGDV